MVLIKRSLLSAFYRIKRACVRDTALSVVQHIAKINLNQPLLSGVSALISKASFFSSFVSSRTRHWIPVIFHEGITSVICFLNNVSLGIAKLKQLWPQHPTSNWVPLPVAIRGVSVPAVGCREGGGGAGPLKSRETALLWRVCLEQQCARPVWLIIDWQCSHCPRTQERSF